MEYHRANFLRNATAGLAALMLLALLGPASGPVFAAFYPPQADSLAKLQQNSLAGVEVQYRRGFPSSVLMEVPVSGATPVERAHGFLLAHADFYLQNHPDVELVYSRSGMSDEDGEFVRFSQTMRGLPVYGAEIVVHMSPDTAAPPQRVFHTIGSLFVPARTSSATPIEPAIDWAIDLDALQAEAAARTAIGSDAAEIVGETRLMLYDPAMFGLPGDARLIWRVHLVGSLPMLYLVDAVDGSILHEETKIAASSGLSDLDMEVWDAESSNFQSNNCFSLLNPNGTKIGDEGGLYPGASITDPEAVQAWILAQSTYLVFHDIFGMHSYDDDDGELLVAVHAHHGLALEPNASANSGCGGIQFSDEMVAFDVMTHEFGHLVIGETSDLNYAYEPGSLNEAYGDIMAMLADTDDWTLGEDIENPQPSLPIRAINFPPMTTCPTAQQGVTTACPDHMSDYIALPGPNDNGGTHANAGIINKAFYLMAAGDTFHGRTVNGMGRVKAGRIIHRAFTGLPSNASFLDARNAAVGRATYLFLLGWGGVTFADVCDVKNAFAAVGLGAGDIDCDGVNDVVIDSDNDGILDDGDLSGFTGDNRCAGGNTLGCDDNCPDDPNPDQADYDNDASGDICDDDSDNDGLPDAVDPCPNWPGVTGDSDGDSIPDCLDPDDDNDGVPDDGDDSGDPYDNPCQDGHILNCDDNCRFDPNPGQYDGNSNGQGDACDPDLDGDGIYGDVDNCTFVSNAGQLDTDGDGIGDACDGCPNTADSINAYTYPVGDEDPVPVQPDSDGDGIPDACDIYAWVDSGMLIDGQPYGVVNQVDSDGALHTLQMSGPAAAGNRVRLPFSACETGAPEGPGVNERIEVELGSLPPGILGRMEDDRGRIVGRFRPDTGGTAHGLRFRPRCQRRYFMVFDTTASFSGQESFTITASTSLPTTDNPWASQPAVFSDPPPPPADTDGDGAWDSVDSCPTVYDPTNADSDHDGIGDACDSTPGGLVTWTLSGVVTSFDEGAGEPDFPGLEQGMPFTGTLTYDTTMSIATQSFPMQRTYAAPAPFAPLELSVRVAGHAFSAGAADDFEVQVEDNIIPGGGDALIVATTDIEEYSATSETMTLTLRDSTASGLGGLQLPDLLLPSVFDTRTIEIELGPAGPVSGNVILQIDQIAQAYDPGRLYWLDSATHKIMSAAIDGSDVQEILTADDPVGFEVDTVADRIYWTECCPGKLRRSDLGGTNVVDLATGLGFPFGIGVDNSAGQLLYAESGFPSELASVPVGGGGSAQVLSVPGTAFGLAVDNVSSKVYWTEFGTTTRIRRANLDGTVVEDLIDSSTDPLGQTRAIALDPDNAKMYWTDHTRDEIRRSNLDGSNQEALVDFLSGELASPAGIALDTVHGKIYWGDTSTHRIQRSNLDGSMVETILDLADGVSFPRDVHVEPGTNCSPPTERVFITGSARLAGGVPEFTAFDPNAAIQVSGYNVYRSGDSAVSRLNWPLVALDVPDGDSIRPDVQWSDISGNPAPNDVWFYSIVGYNAACPLEGPQ